MLRKWVTTDDGIRLSVWVDGPDGASGDAAGVPTIVCVHGYPDNSSLWDGVRGHLRARFRVVTYDVRGAGASDTPKSTAAYRLDRLAADLATVLDEVAPDSRVHLLAHDWGSIQTWHAVTGPWLRDRVASFTSVSGPSLDHAAHWFRTRLRPSPRELTAALTQFLHSGYIAFFQLPVVPELAWRSGIAARIVRRRDPAEPAPDTADAIAGLNLYRANIFGRLRRPRRPDRRDVDIPVQVLAPVYDPFVRVPLQTEIDRWVPDLRVRRITGGHWVVRSDPARIATAAAELVDHVEGKPETRALRRIRVNPPPRPRFSERLVLVTGAGSGIGRATALAFAREGADLVLADIDADSLAHTAREARRVRHRIAGDGPVTSVVAEYPVDVSDGEAMETFADAVFADHGVCDIVVNNAGIGVAGSFLDTKVAEWRRVVDVNLWGVIHGSRLFGARLAERGEGGHIVNVASMAAYLPNALLPAYSTTKAAVLMLSECLRAEFARHRIGVSAVCPGFVSTGIVGSTTFAGDVGAALRRRREAAQRLYDARNFRPERVAEDILRAVERDAPLVASTPEAKAALILSRLTPGLLRAAARSRGTRS